MPRGDRKYIDKPCDLCGVMMHGVVPERKMCAECRIAREKALKKLYKPQPKIKKKKQYVDTDMSVIQKWKEMQKPCNGCAYQETVERLGDESLTMCGYILQTGHSRGCPGGAECTARKEQDPTSLIKTLIKNLV